MKYSIVTFGCRVNQADSLTIEEALRVRGGTPAPDEMADIVVVNTCSVTATADQGARQTIRRIARDNPGARIVVTGCYATRRPEEVRALPGVARVVGNGDKDDLVPLIERELTTAERFGTGEGACGAPLEPGVAGRTAFTLRVQTGCDEACSYCIIPTTRGHGRSLPLDEALISIDRAAAAGFKEIALTGVHLGSYGRDLPRRSTLRDLLGALAARFDEDVLFRVSSLEPMDCTPDLVDLIAEAPCLAPHFHLPLQHASHEVLRRMQRPYTLERYDTLVRRIRTVLPHAAIGSDIIVGFPGETDADFAALDDYLASSPLTHLHVFPYSDRPGTAASAMPGKVWGGVVRDRARRVRAISRDLSQRFCAAQLGTLHRALTIDGGSSAVTGNYLKVKMPPGLKRNEWVDVRIVRVGDLVEGVPVVEDAEPAENAETIQRRETQRSRGERA